MTSGEDESRSLDRSLSTIITCSRSRSNYISIYLALPSYTWCTGDRLTRCEAAASRWWFVPGSFHFSVRDASASIVLQSKRSSFHWSIKVIDYLMNEFQTSRRCITDDPLVAQRWNSNINLWSDILSIQSCTTIGLNSSWTCCERLQER